MQDMTKNKIFWIFYFCFTQDSICSHYNLFSVLYFGAVQLFEAMRTSTLLDLEFRLFYVGFSFFIAIANNKLHSQDDWSSSGNRFLKLLYKTISNNCSRLSSKSCSMVVKKWTLSVESVKSIQKLHRLCCSKSPLQIEGKQTMSQSTHSPFWSSFIILKRSRRLSLSCWEYVVLLNSAQVKLRYRGSFWVATKLGRQEILACGDGAPKYAIDILDVYEFTTARCLTLKNLPFVIALYN